MVGTLGYIRYIWSVNSSSSQIAEIGVCNFCRHIAFAVGRLPSQASTRVRVGAACGEPVYRDLREHRAVRKTCESEGVRCGVCVNNKSSMMLAIVRPTPPSYGWFSELGLL